MNIITVTINPAIDKYGEIENFHYEEPLRVSNVINEPGGKGINISRVIKRFGINSTALFLAGGNEGKLLVELLNQENIDIDYIKISDNTRINTTIYDQHAKKIIKLNEVGPNVDDEEMDLFKDLVKSYSKKDSIFMFCGISLANHTRTIYADLINLVQNNCKYTFLDTDSEILLESLEYCSPDFVKPNREEISKIMGKMPESDEDYIEAINFLRKKIKYPIITADKDGAYFYNDENNIYYHVIPPAVTPKSTVGAGDAFSAGLMFSLSESKSFLESVKIGTAFGTATVLTSGTSLCYPNDMLDILDQVEVIEL